MATFLGIQIPPPGVGQLQGREDSAVRRRCGMAGVACMVAPARALGRRRD